MKGIAKLFLIGFVLVFILSISKVEAIGLALGPSYININNAARGGEYERTLFVFNHYNTDVDLSLDVTGDCSDWIYLYDANNPTEQITSIIVPVDDTATILVKIRIPDDTPTDNYNCTIFAQRAPEEVETGQAFGIRVRSTVNIEVTGDQIITGEVGSITTTDTEINRLLRIKIEFQNTGNVIVKPEIKVTVTKNGDYIDDFSYSEKSFKVNERDYIETEWDTTGQTVGNYTANVKVYLGDNLLKEKDLDFKILERGTLTAEGKILDVSAPTEVNSKQLAKIEVQFQNIGEIDIIAKITGEVYYDGQLIDTISSDEVLVKIGKTETLTSYYKPENPGGYLIKANVLYEGKTIEMDPISISVKSSGLPTGWAILPILTNPIFLGVLLAIIVVVIVVLIKRRRYGSFSYKKFR